MAFYFALLNVSKKDDKEKNTHHRRHRRHSIASVESPLLDYRLLPRPQLLSDDVVISNESAHQMVEHPSSSSSTAHRPLSARRCRGSARASKWVHDNHSCSASTRTTHAPEPPPEPGGSSAAAAAPLSRSKRMAFGGGSEEPHPPRGGASGAPRHRRVQRPKTAVEGKKEAPPTQQQQPQQLHSQPQNQAIRARKEPKNSGNTAEQAASRPLPSKIPIHKTVPRGSNSHPLPISISNSNSRHFSPPPTSSASTTMMKASFQLGGGCSSQLAAAVLVPSVSVFPLQICAGATTDESCRSSSQMSNESSTPRRRDRDRDDSPASSSCDDHHLVTMKLSGISMSSRSSEPRLKKVTFESAPYVISNSFLGEGAGGTVMMVRRGSGTAVGRWARGATTTHTTTTTATRGGPSEVCGDGWWTSSCGGGEGEEEERPPETDNHTNEAIERGVTRSILRRGLIRRRSTSDKTRLLAYRNTGFLSSSQERKTESTPTSRMTVSVDRPKYK